MKRFKTIRTFGLRFLFLLTAVTAVLMAWLMSQQRLAKQEKLVVDRIQSLGGWVTYYHNRWDYEAQVYKSDPIPGPWMVKKLLGENTFARVNYVSLRYRRQSFDMRQLGQLTKLHEIDLVQPYDLSGLDDLPAMPTLERLNLTRVPIHDLRYFSSLEKLNFLSVYGCQSMSCLDGIETLTNIEELWLDSNKALRDIRGIENLPRLSRLHLDYTRLDDWTPLANSHSLEFLSLDQAKFPEIEVLARLTKLETLKLGFRNEPIGSLEAFHNLTRMKHLEIGRCDLDSVECFQYMEDLEMLILKDCPGIKSLKGLEGLSKLKVLSLGSCDVDQKECDRIGALLPNCKIIKPTLNKPTLNDGKKTSVRPD